MIRMAYTQCQCEPRLTANISSVITRKHHIWKVQRFFKHLQPFNISYVCSRPPGNSQSKTGLITELMDIML